MPTLVENTIGTGGDYADLNAWRTAIYNKNFVSEDKVYKGILIDNKSYELSASFNLAATSDATRYAWLTAADSVRHNGTAASGARITCTQYLSGGELFNIGCGFRISNIEINMGGVNFEVYSDYSGVFTRIENCIIHNTGLSVGQSGNFLIGPANKFYFYNNLIYNINSADDASAHYLINFTHVAAGEVEIINNTIAKGTLSAGDYMFVYNMNGNDQGSTIVFLNNVISGFTSQDTVYPVNLYGFAAEDRTAEGNALQGDLPANVNGTGNITTAVFEDYTNNDFTPAASQALHDGGVNANQYISNDLGFNIRTSWDVGAIAYSSTQMSFTNVEKNISDSLVYLFYNEYKPINVILSDYFYEPLLGKRGEYIRIWPKGSDYIDTVAMGEYRGYNYEVVHYFDQERQSKNKDWNNLFSNRIARTRRLIMENIYHNPTINGTEVHRWHHVVIDEIGSPEKLTDVEDIENENVYAVRYVITIYRGNFYESN